MPPLAISRASPLHLAHTSPTSPSQVQLCVSVRTGKLRVAKVRLLTRALQHPNPDPNPNPNPNPNPKPNPSPSPSPNPNPDQGAPAQARAREPRARRGGLPAGLLGDGLPALRGARGVGEI